MKEMLMNQQTVEGESASLTCRYIIMVGEKQVGSFCCEAYGVKIVNDETGESAEFPDLTVSAGRIDELMELLYRNGVTPAGLADVISEWL